MQHLPSIYHKNPTVRIFVAIAIFEITLFLTHPVDAVVCT